MDNSLDNSRRKFLVLGLASVPAVVFAGSALADDPALSESDPQARSLGYRENAATVDRAKFSSYMPGQHCGNCSLFQAGADGKWGGCILFAGKRVADAGWCSSYSTM